MGKGPWKYLFFCACWWIYFDMQVLLKTFAMDNWLAFKGWHHEMPGISNSWVFEISEILLLMDVLAVLVHAFSYLPNSCLLLGKITTTWFFLMWSSFWNMLWSFFPKSSFVFPRLLLVFPRLLFVSPKLLLVLRKWGMFRMNMLGVDVCVDFCERDNVHNLCWLGYIIYIFVVSLWANGSVKGDERRGEPLFDSQTEERWD